MRKSSHTPEYAALRAELKAARTQDGQSQRDLAQRLKVPHSWVAKVENGERRIDFIECCWFLTECGADPIKVLARVAPNPSASRRKQKYEGGR